MDEQTSSSSLSTTPAQNVVAIEKATMAQQGADPSTERTEADHRQAYGTAKTENLRDSGLWRVALPTVVIAFCLVLIAVPLLILIPLLYNSIAALHGGNPQEAQLLWVWIAMIVLEMGIVAVIVKGFYNIFITQAGNYRRS